MSIANPGIDTRLKAISITIGLLVMILSLIAFQGWFLQIIFQARTNLFSPIAGFFAHLDVFTITCLFLSGSFLLLNQFLASSQLAEHLQFTFQRGLATLITLVAAGLVFLGGYQGNVKVMGNPSTSLESSLSIKLPINLTLSFFILGVSLLTIDVEVGEGQRPAQYLAFVVLVLSFFALLGGWYEFTFLGNSAAYTISITFIAFSLLALSIAVFCLRPNKGILAIMRSESIGGVMARHLFPSAIIIPSLLGGLIFLGIQAGYFDAILGLALLAVTQIVIFQMIFWRNSILIHKLDTERNQAREELNQAYEKLAVRVKRQTAEIEVKTKELTEETSARQQAQADLNIQKEKVNRLKDEFLAIISHELRSPLNSILGWATLLRGGKLDTASATRAVEIIERSARSQSLLINDLLDVSLIISGKMRLESVAIDLKSIVTEAVESLRPMIEEKKLDLQISMMENPAKIMGDAERLQQVVRNLLSNAIKFTQASGHIEIKLLDSRDQIMIVVADSGIGIQESFLPFVFDRFRQADSSHTRKFGGLGLGLAIVHHLVELHAGTIKVESAGEGKGATFYVELPKQLPEEAVGIQQRGKRYVWM
ncbi:MAG: HAMP domain-containing sensor histidine kinase [Acidobacteriota bacterium]